LSIEQERSRKEMLPAAIKTQRCIPGLDILFLVELKIIYFQVCQRQLSERGSFLVDVVDAASIP